MKNPWVIIGAIAIILFGGSFWYASVSAEKNNEGVVVESYTKGAEDGSVSLVKYSDFSCPACASFAPVVNEVLSEYPDEVTFEYRHFPFLGPGSTQAAIATEAAGQQGKFYEFHDLLFTNQQTWRQAGTPQTFFLQYAEQAELDMDVFRRHSNASLLREHVQADFAEGRNRGITGTPTFFLNGERMVFETFDEFFAQIDAAVTGSSSAPAVEVEAAPTIEFGI